MAAVCVACGSGGGTTRPGGAQGGVPQPNRTADAVVQAAASVVAARAGGASDLAQLSTALVRVRADGAIEVVVHTVAAVTQAQLDDVRELGADVVEVSLTPAVSGRPPGGMVQLWIPAQATAALDDLQWVAAVAAPSYGSTGG